VKKTIIISANTSWYIYNFRVNLIKQLLLDGYLIIILAPLDAYSERLKVLGVTFFVIPLEAKGKNPIKDFILFIKYLAVFWRYPQSIYLSFTIKPNLYGSLAASFMGVPVINNITGLGVVFEKPGILKTLVMTFYKWALRKSRCVFFQNEEDFKLFIQANLVNEKKVKYLPGSGVDLNRFKQESLPVIEKKSEFTFLLLSRLIYAKGIQEYAQASQIIQKEYPNVRCLLLGFPTKEIPLSKIQEFEDIYGVAYLGASDDVQAEISVADCVVLPSFYREGIPRTLLESAAMGRPIITTDSVGCRNVVDDTVNGFLCKPRDSADLADKMRQILGLSHDELSEMGRRGRIKVEVQYDEKIVINAYLDVIKNL
jgi:glycosyltransferase involved in cell wall biosynthesis